MARALIGFVCLALVFIGCLAGDNNANSSLVQKNPLCVACVDFTGRIQNDITTEVIGKFLNGLCDLTGDGLVNKECSKIMSALENRIDIHFDAQEECDTLMMCGKWSNVMVKIAQDAEDATREAEKLTDEILSKAVDRITKLDPLNLKINVLCRLCKAIVNCTNKSLEPIKNAIINFVDSICKDLPEPTNEACLKYLNQAIEEWWADIFKTPEKVCTFLRLCRSDKTTTSTTAKSTSSSTTTRKTTTTKATTRKTAATTGSGQ